MHPLSVGLGCGIFRGGCAMWMMGAQVLPSVAFYTQTDIYLLIDREGTIRMVWSG